MATRALKSASNEDTGNEELKDALKEILQIGEGTYNSETLTPALQGIYAEMGLDENAADATIHISMLEPDGKGSPEASIWRGDPDDYDLPDLARKFGSAQYRVKIYVKLPNGQRVVKANKVIPWKLSKEEEDRLKNPIRPDTVTNQTIADAVAAAMKSVLPALQPQQSIQPANRMSEMMEMAQLLKALQPPPPPVQNPMDIINATIQMMQSMKPDTNDDPPPRGSAGSNDVIIAMINKAGPVIERLMAGGTPQAPMQNLTPSPDQVGYDYNIPPQAIPEPASQISAPVIESPKETEQVDLAKMQLKMGINFLIGQCAAGGLPETYAEVVLDSVPPDSVDQLLKEADPVAWLAAIEPKVNEHKPWFEQLIKACREMLTPDPEA